MDALILATKDGDWSRLRAFPGLDLQTTRNDSEEESEETEYEEEKEV